MLKVNENMKPGCIVIFHPLPKRNKCSHLNDYLFTFYRDQVNKRYKRLASLTQ